MSSATRSSATGLAGIMGGEESEIIEGTTDVMFECAAFDRTAIRLTSRALGMRTEASGRFERGVCAATVMDALDRACHAGERAERGRRGHRRVSTCIPTRKPQQVITASVERIQNRGGRAHSRRRHGAHPQQAELRGSTRDGDTLTVTVPAFREDLDGEADICEECLRMYGYDHIGATPLKRQHHAGRRQPHEAPEEQRRARLLHGHGLSGDHELSPSPAGRRLHKLGLPEGDLRMQPMRHPQPSGRGHRRHASHAGPAICSTPCPST